mmetsp:Transcript_16206/g.44868  ORF Transcript_16206/g.44868 Transcript_16206/m.44868 type:complete len:552 (+) Transcript_16206:54-1709(+)
MVGIRAVFLFSLVTYLFSLFRVHFMREEKLCLTAASFETNVKGSFAPSVLSVSREPFSPATSKNRSAHSGLPMTLVIYFPQYHRDPLNDRNWGENFTDWDSLRRTRRLNKLKQTIPRPLSPKRARALKSRDELNDLPPQLKYYDLEDTEPRRIQGILAKKYGIDGFIYHHYWFYDESHRGPNLAKPLENMLKDGHPDVPFLLNWCAVKWVNVWMGKAIFQTTATKKYQPITLQEQFFNATQEMIYEHYLWLKPFFEHPNYIRVNGEPAFLLYYYDHRALPILESLRKFAMEDGFSGLHFIVGRSSHPEELYDTSHLVDGQAKMMTKTAQTKDHVDPTKSESRTKSILGALSSVSGNSLSSLLQLNISQREEWENEEQTWNYNPFNQTMTYPYPLKYLTRPFENPAWCTDPTRVPEHDIHSHHPEIIGVITAFDNTPRRRTKGATIWNTGLKDTVSASPNDTIQRFAKSYSSALYYQKCCIDVARFRQQEKESISTGFELNPLETNDRFVAINAMNEWAEGMAIEPSNVYGYLWLETIKKVQETVQKQSCVF